MKSWLTLFGCIFFALPVFSQINLTFEKTDPTCFNYTNGIAVVNATGGVEPYSYHWQNGLTWNQWWGVPAGTYSVTVTDANGASAVGSVSLSHPPHLSVSIEAVDVFCEGFQGSLEAKPVGGTPPYDYQWNNGMAEAIANNITAGDWMVTVLDSKKCHDVGTRFVDIPSQIFPNIVPVDPTCATCDNGEIVVSTFGNHPPFNYSWGNGSSSTTLTGLPPGNYPLTVTDQNGCALTFETALNSPFGPITVEATGEPITCFGQNNGVVKAVVTGGSGNHTFVWRDQANQIVGTDGIVQNLGPGTYCLTVTDDTGTTGTDCATVVEPTQLNPTISITPTSTGGTVNITILGGTAPYHMTLDGAVITSLTLDLPPKNYYYLCVMDANGCQVDIPFEILNPDCIDVSVVTGSTQCTSANSGTATAIVSGGSGNFMYTWAGPGGPFISIPTITMLAGGTYSVTVTDLNQSGCTGTASGTVIAHTTIVLSASATDASCSGVADGSATVDAFNGQTPYTYLWDTNPTQSTQSITSLLPGTYQVTVTDAVGCSKSAAVNVGTGSAPNAAFSVASIVCDGANSTVTLVNNSTNGTLYKWSVAPLSINSTDQNLSPFSATNGQSVIVELVVTNAAGCSDTESQPVTIPPGAVLTMPSTIKECASEAVINASFADLFSLSWDGPAPFNPMVLNPTVTQSGTYCLTATNSVGCSASSCVVVDLSAGVDIALNENLPIDNCDNSTSVSATTIAGATYDWILNGDLTTATGANFTTTNLLAAPGKNIIIVTATVGACTGSDTLEVFSNPLNATILGDTELCIGEPGGMVSVNITPANQTGITYVWTGQGVTDPELQSQTVSTNTVGTFPYSVVVTNADGCTKALELMVDVKDGSDISTAINNVPCNDRLVNFSSGTNAGTWNFGDGSPISSQTNPVHIYAAPGTYIVTFNPTAECTNPVIDTIEVTNADVITAAFDATLGPDCSTTTLLNLKDLTNGSTSWSWTVTNPVTTSIKSNPDPITVSANGPTTVTLIVKNAAGCLDTLSKTLTVENLITPAPVLASGLTICPTDCVELNPGGNPNNYVFTWSNGLTGANPTVCPTTTTTYNLTVTNVNCVWNGSTTVTVNPAASVNAGSDVSVCSNDLLTLSATGNGTFCWSVNPNFIPCLSTTSTATIDPTQVSTIYVQTTVGSCIDSDTINIDNNTLEITGNPATTPINNCLGNSSTFGVNAIPGTPMTFLWSNGMTVDMLTESPTVSTTYSVTATNAAGCTDALSFPVEVIDLQPQLSVSAMKTEVCPNEQVPLLATMTGNPGPFTYNWTGAGLDFTDRPDPIASPTDSTTYTVTVTDAFGCTAVDDVRLRFINVTCAEPFIFLPNAFTPFDGNEVNNVLRVRGNNIKEMDFYIYDRWGEKMFESHNVNDGWDGKFKDKELTPDAYGFYLRVTCDDNTTFKKQGNVTLLR